MIAVCVLQAAMTIRAKVDKWPVADRIKQAFLEWLPEEGFVLDEEPGPGFSQLKLEELRPPFSLSDAKDILSQLATGLTLHLSNKSSYSF